MSAPRFVSEPLVPTSLPVSVAALAAGEPSLPKGFRWRDREYEIIEVLSQRKVLKQESFSGEKYVRRHQYRLRMDDGTIWTVYFVRHPPRSGISKPGAPRWYLQTIDADDEPPKA